MKIGQRLRRQMARPNLAGAGLTERMRSMAFALLGLTAAAGLGMVAIFSQQGWPLLSPSPLPAAGGPVAVGDAAIVTGLSGVVARGASRGDESRELAVDHPSVETAPVSVPVAVPNGGSTGIAVQSPAPQADSPEPGGPQPPESSDPEPTPAPQPPAEIPAPSSGEAPVPAPVTPPNPPVTSTAEPESDPVPGKGHAYGHTKSLCEESPVAEPPEEQEPPDELPEQQGAPEAEPPEEPDI